ncbi:hypothetical protein ACF1AE_04565 [Streptomyces sp. NPDC014986]|uniref:hypothetical protein n=1 Tax=Streptomyces sp. NPDC014986 TaxID=3364934 RepID=UPI0037019C39
MSGAAAVDGAPAEPLVPGIATRAEPDGENDGPAVLADPEPEDGWTSGWWSDRWIRTAAGGALAALAGVAGHRLTRGSGRPPGVPPTA